MIAVAIINKSKYSTRNIDKYFSSSVFRLVDLETTNISTTSQETKRDIKGKRTINALEQAKQQYPDLPVIVLSNRVVTHASAKRIKDVIKRLKDEEFDVTYLMRVMEHCQKTRKVRNITTNDYNIYHSSGSIKAEAVFYSVDGRDRILGDIPMRKGEYFTINKSYSKSLKKAISNGYLVAYSMEPGLFSYDISNNSEKSKYYNYSCSCAPYQPIPQSVPRLGTMGLILLITIIVVVLICAWALIYVGPKG